MGTQASATPLAGSPFIAADVGGTHVRLALVRAQGDGIDVLAFHKYECTQHAALEVFIKDFLATQRIAAAHGVIASAGYALDDGSVITTNLPWPLNIAQTRDALGFADLRLVNDFEAVAYAAATLPDEQTHLVCGPGKAASNGPIVVLGPGTGLGVAVWVPARASNQGFVLATEAGQSSLAPGNALELQLLAHGLHRQPNVSIEWAISGPGIQRLYNALCELRGVPVALHSPADITHAAQVGGHALAKEALDVFCGILGGAVGDMAMNYGASGGIRLAGGFLPQIRDYLMHSSFATRFLDKGGMRAALEKIPVRLVEHGQLGVIGAASWYLGQLAAQQEHYAIEGVANSRERELSHSAK